MVWVKKTLNIDAALLADARRACRAANDTETIRLGLQALLRDEAYQQLLALTGSEAGARDVPRRRQADGGRAPRPGSSSLRG